MWFISTLLVLVIIYASFITVRYLDTRYDLKQAQGLARKWHLDYEDAVHYAQMHLETIEDLRVDLHNAHSNIELVLQEK